ncbi:class I SAM-dependent methyltransferase [Kibdelosporangium philippinense]|uniref:Class I SAM-dependent methyltransferase n=1 Tax=Kibdelosporangium philippinense TaxID=211113 RepID=A0ABS8ZI98_9PSEU|nr:class I SAM-dependent methyltransferase [Kibdelosporangium philippinense]MCE7007277.1 class I SAM-dependent methyltransferase [Kibdelosporangium philippinense]
MSTWYTTFFTHLPNEFWRRLAPPSTADIDFVERHLRLTPGARVLDVPCGSGRHSITLAERGYRVTGVDSSAEAIEHARVTSSAVEWIEADMRDIPRDGRFDVAICMGNSFGYMDHDGSEHFLEALGAAVRPGGGIVLDIGVTAESVLPGFGDDREPMVAGDITAYATSSYDVATSQLITDYRFVQGDREHRGTAVYQVFTVAHLSRMLSTAGFGRIELYSGPDDVPFHLGSPRLMLTAIRI